MAFVTNVREFQALLDACSLTQGWEMLTYFVLTPDQWIPMASARLSELTAQEITVSNFFRLSSYLMTVSVSTVKQQVFINLY